MTRMMQKSLFFFLMLPLLSFCRARLPQAQLANINSGDFALAGYLQHSSTLQYVVVKDHHIAAITADQDTLPSGIKVIQTEGFILPGLIDLHGHLQYHVLPLWQEAHGQFINRFEWRSRPGAKERYNKAVKDEMLAFDAPHLECAAVRFAELRALTGGVTTIQGGPVAVRIDDEFVPCSSGFAVRNVEAFGEIMPGKSVKSFIDIVSPFHLKFFKKEIEPKIATLGSYDKALQAASSRPNANSYIADFENKTRRPILEGLANGKLSAVVTHLAEGRRDDPFTQAEFSYLKTFGLDLKGMVLIHALGLSPADLRHAAARGMHLVWSPFSNLLLYGNTLDVAEVVKAAAETGIPLNLSLGTDWAPSGSRHLLDELKMARRYLDRAGVNISNDVLLDMVTKNPARALGAEGRLGTVAVGAEADLIVIPRLAEHAADSLLGATEENIELVMIAGEMVYGKSAWLRELGVQGTAEELAAHGPNCPKEMAFRLGAGGAEEATLAAAQDPKQGNASAESLRSAKGLQDVLNAAKKNMHAATPVNPLFGCEDSAYRARFENFIPKEFDPQKAEDKVQHEKIRKQWGIESAWSPI